MTRDEAVARIQRGIDFRTDQTDNIIDALKEAQRTLERGRSLPYFLLEEDATLAVTSGTQAVSLPTGFLREKDNETLYYTNSDDEVVSLEKIELDVARSRFASTDPGAPVAYVLRKDSITIYPEPDDDYSLTWSYYKAADALDTDIENAWLEEELGAPEVLIGKAGMIIAADLRNDVALARFQQMYSEAWMGMFADGEERDHAGRAYEMGSRL